MEWLTCKACGSSAIIPMDVEVDDVDLTTGELDFDSDELSMDLDEHDHDGGDGVGDFDPADAFEDDPGHELADGEQESRFYSCHVCGDNWLAVKEHESEGACLVTFIHQMGMAPVLKRVAHMQTHIVINESTVDNWEYYLDDEIVDESDWTETLNSRRQVLKSVCTN